MGSRTRLALDRFRLSWGASALPRRGASALPLVVLLLAATACRRPDADRSAAATAEGSAIATSAVAGATLPSSAAGSTQRAPGARAAQGPLESLPVPTDPNGSMADDGPSGTSAAPDRGDLVLEFKPAEDPYFDDLAADMRADGVFRDVVDTFNEDIALPRDIPVTFEECGEDNAFYDPETGSILMCYELVEQLESDFQDDGDGSDQAFYDALDSAAFMLYHEIGHALVDVLALPITGREEDAVDDLATVLVIETWNDGDDWVLTAAQSFRIASEIEDEASDPALWDEHALDLQRYYNIACLAYGSNPDAHQDLVADGTLPEERADLCPEDYDRKVTSWDTLLADQWKN